MRLRGRREVSGGNREESSGIVGRDLSNFRNTRALGGVEPDASISLRPLSISLFLSLFFSPPPFSSSSLAPYFPLRRKAPAPLPLPPFRFDPTPFLAPSRSAPSPSPVRWRPMIPDFSISPSTCKRGCFSGVSESESCRGTEIGNCHSKRQTLSRRDDFGFF
jgi:hypothetical protein